MTRFSAAPIRIGFGFRGRSWAYTHPVKISKEVTYAAQDKAQLLGELGISANDFELDFFGDEEDKEYAEQLFDQLGIARADARQTGDGRKQLKKNFRAQISSPAA